MNSTSWIPPEIKIMGGIILGLIGVIVYLLFR